MQPHPRLRLAGPSGRRQFLLRTGVALGSPALAFAAQAHNAAGLVEGPLAPPSFRFRLNDGSQVVTEQLLKGRVTALQLMFTGCSATCPIQGALFADLERRLLATRLPSQPRLLSVSIDPLGDDPAALSAWLRSFGAGAMWKAASPAVSDLDPWLDYLQGRQTGVDRHTGQVYLFDRAGRLVLRTVDFPVMGEVARLIADLVARKD